MSRYEGLERAILAQREGAYEAARLRRPDRWTRTTRKWTPIESESGGNLPDLHQH